MAPAPIAASTPERGRSASRTIASATRSGESTGGGYNSQSDIPLHFGLAKLEPVTVEATFMSRQGRKKQRITNVNPADLYGKTLVIREAP